MKASLRRNGSRGCRGSSIRTGWSSAISSRMLCSRSKSSKGDETIVEIRHTSGLCMLVVTPEGHPFVKAFVAAFLTIVLRPVGKLPEKPRVDGHLRQVVMFPDDGRPARLPTRRA